MVVLRCVVFLGPLGKKWFPSWLYVPPRVIQNMNSWKITNHSVPTTRLTKTVQVNARAMCEGLEMAYQADHVKDPSHLEVWKMEIWCFEPQSVFGEFVFFSGCVWRFIGSKSCKSEKKRNVVCFFGDACQPTKDKKLHTVRERKLNKFNKTINNTFPISSPCSQISVLFVCGQKIHGIHGDSSKRLSKVS